ncbi:MAG: putative zinc-binding protein [Smithellaceae bacterium]
MAECCEGGTKLIYSCSGSADVGEIADHVTRKLRDDGFAKMTCLAGVGAGLSGYVQSVKGADEVITIDGCVTACARKSLERIGVQPTSYILTDLGLEKHETPVTDQVVNEVLEKIKKNVGFSANPTCPSGDGCCGM